MTLDEAIKHCEEEAEKYMEYGIETECYQCGKEHEQLAEWLRELKDLREENKVLTSECDRLIKEKGKLLKKSEQIAEYKRLLDLAHHDLRAESICRNCKWRTTGLDTVCRGCRGGKWEWAHAAEALALIGEDGDTNG